MSIVLHLPGDIGSTPSFSAFDEKVNVCKSYYMADKRIPLVTNEFYHVFNRGAARQPIFLSPSDYRQAKLTIDYYRFAHPPIRLGRLKELSIQQRNDILLQLHKEHDVQVDIISFVLMPNHFHFLLRQIKEKGISTFISKFTNSYTRFLNTKHDSVGPIVQGIFKSVHIETDEQLLHVSRYIHLNPLIGHVVTGKDFLLYSQSSLPDFLQGNSNMVTLEPVLNQFKSPQAYKAFILDQVDYAKELHDIKHLMLEE